MRRVVLGGLIAAVILVAAGFLLVRQTGVLAGQFVVRGRVTSADGRPAAGVKVWLNALPGAATVREFQGQPVSVTVVSSAITSAAGFYAIRVSSSQAGLARGTAGGAVRFSLMTGDSAGVGTARFSARVVSGLTGASLALPSGDLEVADLHLARVPG
jgi:hypothetical protein